MPRTIPHWCTNWPKRVLTTFLDLLFPPHCAGCGSEGISWCRACIQSIQTVSGHLCETCGLPLEGARSCFSCERVSPSFRARSYAWYSGPLRRALVALKYRPDRHLSGWMADRLIDILEQEDWPRMVIVPVPLSKKKFNRRGYNQVELIARQMACILETPCKASSLRRIRETQSQVGLPADARRENVDGAFQADANDLRGEMVLLIDDLFTTGATLSSCAQALKAVDVTAVYALTVARASGSDLPVKK